MAALGANITPIKLGVKFSPPAIILIYNDKSKLRKRVIPAKGFDLLTDIRLYVEKFKLDPRYRKYFDKIQATKLEKIFFILQDNMKGYTLKESMERAKKYDKNGLDDAASTTAEVTAANIVKDTLAKKYSSKEYDEEFDDFHDTDDEDSEDEKNPPSVSTISDVKAKHDLEAAKKNETENKGLFATLTMSSSLGKQPEPIASSTMLSKNSALDLLSSQLQSVKTKTYDFEEDEIEDEEINNKDDDDEDEEDDNNILNFLKPSQGKKKEDEKIETAGKDSDDESSSF